MDQLNTHKSESLVRWVAHVCDIQDELGEKGKSGILKSMKTRADFLIDESHRVRFVYTPVHASWLNQIECWFSILVRRLLKRGSFTSIQDLQQRILDFIDFLTRRWPSLLNGLTLADPLIYKAYHFCHDALPTSNP